MAAINVEKTCSVLPSPPQYRAETFLLTDRDVNKILERKLGSDNFRLVDWRLEPLGKSMGLLGQYYRLYVTARVNGKTEGLQLFAKTPPPSGSSQHEFLQRCDLFNKEIAIYTDLMQRMGAGGPPRWMVECYLGKQNTIIVLEDASLDGYATLDKYTLYDEEHCVWMLRTLAKFHSRSLMLDERLRREGDRTLFELYGHLLKEMLYIDGDDRSEKALSSGITGVCAMIDLIEVLDDNRKAVAKRRIIDWSRKMSRLTGASCEHRNVVCHRDVWANNIMFRHDPVSGNPNGCYIIDFQFFRYSPPAIDFACFLYLTTDRATRDRNFDFFARIYHNALALCLAEEGLDVNDHLPWTAFRKSYAEARDVALIYAALNLQIILLSSETIADYLLSAENEKLEQILHGNERPKLVLHQCENVSAYKTRILEILHEVADRLPDHPPNF